MKALMSTKVGGPDTLEMLDVDDPTPGKGQVIGDARSDRTCADDDVGPALAGHPPMPAASS